MRCPWRQGIGPDVGVSVRTGREGQLAGVEFVLLADCVVVLNGDRRRGGDARPGRMSKEWESKGGAPKGGRSKGGSRSCESNCESKMTTVWTDGFEEVKWWLDGIIES